MAKRIIFSKKAELDLERIISFNNRRNKSDTYSKQLYVKLLSRLKSLVKQPESGKLLDDNTRLLIWDDYYIFYDSDEVRLLVLAIYHQKENIEF